jgi:hypothetical protein
MPRIKSELLEEGMIVAKDVKNIDDMLLIPAGSALSDRQINILQSWGVDEIEVQKSDSMADTDPLAKLAPEEAARLSAEVKARFWQADEANPVYLEIFKLILHRRARRGH